MTCGYVSKPNQYVGSEQGPNKRSRCRSSRTCGQEMNGSVKNDLPSKSSNYIYDYIYIILYYILYYIIYYIILYIILYYILYYIIYYIILYIILYYILYYIIYMCIIYIYINMYIYIHNHRYITEEATTLQFRFGRLRSKRPKSQMYDGWLGLPASGTQSFQSPNSPKLPTSWYTK